MLKKLACLLTPLLTLSLIFPSVASAYEVPKENSKAEYFYVFGPKGDPLRGKEDSQLVLFVDVPKGSTEPVTISVYDPDTSGKVDAIGGFGKPVADTETVFSVWGKGKTPLAKQAFTSDYDGKWYKFGPFAPDSGRSIGEFNRFKVLAKSIKGDDQNLFKVRISPEYAETFSENITFRLNPSKGGKVYFHPEVADGVTNITFRNFDLDADGGKGVLTDTATGKKYEVADSKSGQWQETKVSLGDSRNRRLQYQVTTTNQTRGNAGVQILDPKGNSVPIYFKKGGYVAPQAPVNACNIFVFDATQSYDRNNDQITYLWDFADGTTSTEPIVKHAFQNAGTYDVSLTVTDNSGLHCQVDKTKTTVSVNTPPEAMIKAPQTACVGQAVSIKGIAKSPSQNISYHWGFSDGTTASGANVSKAFSKGGVYDVQLNVDDNQNSTCSTAAASSKIMVNTAPVANAGEDIALCLNNSAAEYAVDFNASGSYDADKDSLNYRWDFGDGTSAEGAKVTHVYKSSGKYVARLTVSDASSGSCSVATDTVNVYLNKVPAVDAGADQFSCAGREVTLSAKGMGEEGENLKYTWDFGDGTTGTGATAKHRYSEGGSYTATVTVDDGMGSPCSVTTDVVNVGVNSAPTVQVKRVEDICAGSSVVLEAMASDADGDKVKYIWDLGDGTVVEGGSQISHQYAQPGNYPVRVRVEDGSGSSCGSAQANTTVTVQAPVSVDAGQDISSCDKSVSLSADGPKGAKYMWDFGDGTTGEGKNVTHKYSRGGNYTATVTVDSGTGLPCAVASDATNIMINSRPDAQLSQVEVACVGDKVVLDASSSSDPDGGKLKYIWNLGDGTVVEGGSQISHQYAKGGNYKASVRVEDGSGQSCNADTASVAVKVNTPPIANAGPNLVCCTDEMSQFDGSASSDPDGNQLTYHWSYGDGGSGKGARVQHAYKDFGQYNVALTVDDGQGTHCSTASSGFLADVNAGPVAVIAVRQA